MAGSSRSLRLARAILSASIALGVTAARMPSARADDAQAQGRALFNEGAALMSRGDFEAACPKLEASLRHFPGLGTRGKLAECYEKLGRVASAWRAYRDVAELAMKSGDPTREQVASARAKALEPKLSYVTVVVPPGADVPGLVVKRGGHEIERAKLGGAEPVDAGAVTIEVSAPGRTTFTGQITVAQAQHARFEVPVLERASPASPPAAPAAAAPAPALASEPASFVEPPPVHADRPAWQKPVGIVAMGAGVVAASVGAAFGLGAGATYDAAFEGGGCERGGNTCDAAGQRKVDDARTQATLSTILFVAGGAVAATGLVVYLTAPSSKSSGMRVSPAPHVGGGGFVASGTF